MFTRRFCLLLLFLLNSSCTNISPEDLPETGATSGVPVAGDSDKADLPGSGSSNIPEAVVPNEIISPNMPVSEDGDISHVIKPSSSDISDTPPSEDSEDAGEMDEESFHEIHTTVIGEGEQEEALLESFSNILKDFEKSLQEGELKRKAESESMQNEVETQVKESVTQTEEGEEGGGEGKDSKNLITPPVRDHSDFPGDGQQETTSESSSGSNSTIKKVTCLPRNSTDVPSVQIVNATALMSLLFFEQNVKSRTTPATCVLLMFFARWCQFSTQAAPHFNALARAFPDVHMYAIDAMKYHSLNTQYGTVAVPTLLLFHNGRPATKFNESSYTLETFAAFVSKHTNLSPDGLLNVTSADFNGPVPSRTLQETDIWLWLSWLFIIWCTLHFFVKSALWERIVETVGNTWREAEAQHEHAD